MNSYFAETTGGQLIPALQFLVDHKLIGLLPAAPEPRDADPPNSDGWVITNTNARIKVYDESIRASAIVDSFASNFIGRKTIGEFLTQAQKDENTENKDNPNYKPYVPQSLQWPRSNFNGSPVIVGGHEIPVDEVPDLVCLATAHVAIKLINKQNPYGHLFTLPKAESRAIRGALKRDQVGALVTEYYDVPGGAALTQGGEAYTVSDMLAPLFSSGIGSLGVVRVV